MIPYRLDYTIEKTSQMQDFNVSKTLKDLTGKSLNKNEAQNIWSDIQKHKWLVSKSLGRDVGLRAAAVDYIENFHQSKTC